MRSLDEFIREYKDKEILKYKISSFDDFTGHIDKFDNEYIGGTKIIEFPDVDGYEVEIKIWGGSYKDANKRLTPVDYYTSIASMACDEVIESNFNFAKVVAENILVAGAKAGVFIASKKKTKKEKYMVQRFWANEAIIQAEKALRLGNSQYDKINVQTILNDLMEVN